MVAIERIKLLKAIANKRLLHGIRRAAFRSSQTRPIAGHKRQSDGVEAARHNEHLPRASICNSPVNCNCHSGFASQSTIGVERIQRGINARKIAIGSNLTHECIGRAGAKVGFEEMIPHFVEVAATAALSQ